MSGDCNWFDQHLSFEAADKSQKVYRIIDFFAAAQAVSENRIYVPLAANFEDPNEGLDAAVSLLEASAGPCAGIAKYFRSSDEFIEYQKSIASRTYVSCWSSTKESVAMWALYSKDHASVRIATNIRNIERATVNFARNSSDPGPAISEGNNEGQFLARAKISKVRYDDLATIGEKIDRRRRAYDKLESAGLIKSNDLRMGASKRDSDRRDQYKFSALEIKDSSFAHEAEVRLILEFAKYSPMTLAIAASDIRAMGQREANDLANPDYERNMLMYAREILIDESRTNKFACASNIILPLHPGFVTEISIDPRCSPHKRRFMEDYFSGHGVPIVESTCFGHAARHFSVVPRAKLLDR